MDHGKSGLYLGCKGRGICIRRSLATTPSKCPSSAPPNQLFFLLYPKRFLFSQFFSSQFYCVLSIMCFLHRTLWGIIGSWNLFFKMTSIEPQFYDSSLFSLATGQVREMLPSKDSVGYPLPQMPLAHGCCVQGLGWRLRHGVSAG